MGTRGCQATKGPKKHYKSSPCLCAVFQVFWSDSFVWGKQTLNLAWQPKSPFTRWNRAAWTSPVVFHWRKKVLWLSKDVRVRKLWWNCHFLGVFLRNYLDVCPAKSNKEMLNKSSAEQGCFLNAAETATLAYSLVSVETVKAGHAFWKSVQYFPSH